MPYFFFKFHKLIPVNSELSSQVKYIGVLLQFMAIKNNPSKNTLNLCFHNGVVSKNIILCCGGEVAEGKICHASKLN